MSLYSTRILTILYQGYRETVSAQLKLMFLQYECPGIKITGFKTSTKLTEYWTLFTPWEEKYYSKFFNPFQKSLKSVKMTAINNNWQTAKHQYCYMFYVGDSPDDRLLVGAEHELVLHRGRVWLTRPAVVDGHEDVVTVPNRDGRLHGDGWTVRSPCRRRESGCGWARTTQRHYKNTTWLLTEI